MSWVSPLLSALIHYAVTVYLSGSLSPHTGPPASTGSKHTLSYEELTQKFAHVPASTLQDLLLRTLQQAQGNPAGGIGVNSLIEEGMHSAKQLCFSSFWLNPRHVPATNR